MSLSNMLPKKPPQCSSTSPASVSKILPAEVRQSSFKAKEKSLIREDAQREQAGDNSTIRQYHNHRKHINAHDDFKANILDKTFGVVCRVCFYPWYKKMSFVKWVFSTLKYYTLILRVLLYVVRVIFYSTKINCQHYERLIETINFE